MKIPLLPYVNLEVDDRLRRRMRRRGERLRVHVRAYLLSAADDVDAAGDRVRGLCDRAVTRVDSVVAGVNDRISPAERADLRPGGQERSDPGLRVVAEREAS